jgi:hypothetical protein
MFQGERILVSVGTPQRGLDLCRDLRAFGGQAVGPVLTISQAFECLTTPTLKGVILDGYLQDGSSSAVAGHLGAAHPLCSPEPSVVHPPIRTFRIPDFPCQVIRELEAEIKCTCSAT